MKKPFLESIGNVSILETAVMAEHIIMQGDVPTSLFLSQNVVVKFEFPPNDEKNNNNSFEVEREIHMMVARELVSKTSHLLAGLESGDITITEFSKLQMYQNENVQLAWQNLVEKQPEIVHAFDDHQMSIKELQTKIRSKNDLSRLRKMQYLVVPQLTGQYTRLSELLQNNKYSKLFNDPDFTLHVAFQVAQVLCVFDEYKMRHNNLTLDHIFVEVLTDATTLFETFPFEFQYESQYRVKITDFSHVGSEYVQNRSLSQEKCDSEGTCTTFVKNWDWYTFLTNFIGFLERKKNDTALLREFYGGRNTPIKLIEYSDSAINVKSDMDVGKACICVESKTKKNSKGNVIVQCIKCKVDIDRLSLMKDPLSFVQAFLINIQQETADRAARKKIHEKKQEILKSADTLSVLPQKQKLHILERHLRFAQHDESREKKLSYQTEAQMVEQESKERDRHEREYRAISEDWDEERTAELEKRKVRTREQRRKEYMKDIRKTYNHHIKIYEQNIKNGVPKENLQWINPAAIEKKLSLRTAQKEKDWKAFDQEQEKKLRREASKRISSPEEIARKIEILIKQQKLDLQAAAQEEKEKLEHEAAQNAKRRSRFATDAQIYDFSNQIGKQKQLDDEAWLSNVLANYETYLQEKTQPEEEDQTTPQDEQVVSTVDVLSPALSRLHKNQTKELNEIDEPRGLHFMTENDINDLSDEAFFQKTLAEYDQWILEKVESGEREADTETIQQIQIEIEELVNFSLDTEQLQELEATFAKKKQEMYLGEYDNITCRNLQNALKFQDKFNQRYNVSWTNDMPAAAYYFHMMKQFQKNASGNAVEKDEYAFPLKLPENCRKKRIIYPYNLSSKQTKDLKNKILDPEGFEVVSASYFNSGDIVVVQDDSSREVIKEARKYLSSSEGHVYTLQQLQHNIQHKKLPIQLKLDSDMTMEHFLAEMFPERLYDFTSSENADFYITRHDEPNIEAKKLELEDRKSSMQVVRITDLLHNTTSQQYYMEQDPIYLTDIDESKHILEEKRLMKRIENAQHRAQQTREANVQARLEEEKRILDKEFLVGDIDSLTLKKKYQRSVERINFEEFETMVQNNDVQTLDQARIDEMREQQENLNFIISMATLVEKQLLMKPEIEKLFASRHPYYQSQTLTDLVILFHKVQSQVDNDSETKTRIVKAKKHWQKITSRYSDELIGETSAALYYFAHLDPKTYQLTDMDKHNCIQLEIERLVHGSLDKTALVKLGMTFTEQKKHIYKYDEETAQYFKRALKYQDMFNAKFLVPWSNDIVAAAYNLYLHEIDKEKPFGELEEYTYPLKLSSNLLKQRTVYPYHLSSIEIADLQEKILDPAGFKIMSSRNKGEIVLVKDGSPPHIIEQAKKYIINGSSGHVFTVSQFKHKIKYNMLPVQVKIDSNVTIKYLLNHFFPNKYDVISAKEPDFYLIPDKKTKKLRHSLNILPLSGIIDDLNFYFYGTTNRMTQKELKIWIARDLKS